MKLRQIACAVLVFSAGVLFAEEISGTPAVKVDKAAAGGRRMRPPRDRRKDGAIPGLVTYPFGKTASGERTHIYRIMGQGGVVADFLDYGARLYRLYLPDATGSLVDVIADAKPSIIDYEKAGDLAAVWQMTPIRKPRATGLVFESSNFSNLSNPSNLSPTRVVYWLDAQNRLSVESTLAGTNATPWCAALPIAPLVGGRSLAITAPTDAYTLAATTNITLVALRPLTNETQKIGLKLVR